METPPVAPPRHQASLWQFILSLLAIFGLLGCAALTGLLGLLGQFVIPDLQDSTLQLFLLTIGLVAISLLLLPSGYLGLRRFLNNPSLPALPSLSAARGARLLLVIPPMLLPIVLLLGIAVGRTPLYWLGLPLLHVLAVGLPILWLVYISIRHLPLGSPQRAWGVLGGGLTLGPGLILIIELSLMLLLFIIFFAYLQVRPELAEQFEALIQRLTFVGSETRMMQILGEYILHPAVILLALSSIALVVPLVEEIFKPVGVWLLAGRQISPAEGFAAGVISGAAYALFESLAASLPSSPDEWAYIVTARIGTAVIHIATTSLTGWALAAAWQSENRWRGYLKLGLAYLLAVSLHSLWNGMTIITAFSALAKELGRVTDFPLLARLGSASFLALYMLGLGGLVFLVKANRLLRHVPQPASTLEETSESML